MNDLRFKILSHFEDLDSSTSETVANQWLAERHDDLGTIKRSLIDLIESDFIRLSSIGNNDPVEWLNTKWDSTTYNKPQTQDDKDKKSSKRLIQDVGKHKKVADVKMYTTVKGLMFIKEYRRFKYHYYWVIGVAVLSFLLGVALQYLSQPSDEDPRKTSKPEMTIEKSTTKYGYQMNKKTRANNK